MRRIVSNTGPILHLHEIGALDLLAHAGDVCIPTVVQDELRRWILDWPGCRPAWLAVAEPDAAHAGRVRPWLDAGIIHSGEASALALAHQLQADWFLTDDTAARLLARSLNLEAHGSLGVVLWAAAVGHLRQDQAEELVNALARSSLWISPRIIAEARTALRAMFL